MYYNTIYTLASIEHEQRVRSMCPVPGFGLPATERKHSGRRFPMLLRPILTVLVHFVMR